MSKFLVIYYHEVVPKGQGYSYQRIEVDKFEEQMRFLKENGFHTICFKDLDCPIPDRSVIISFDDGFRSVYEYAAPIMKKYQIPGNIYLPTNFIGNHENFLTWEMINDLKENYGFDFAAHTHNHIDVRTVSQEELEREIKNSDSLFSEKLGVLPDVFCLPFGAFDRRSLLMISEFSRYKLVLGSFYGVIDSNKMQEKVLPRIGISNDDSIEIFKQKISGNLNWKGPLQRMRMVFKSLFGTKAYVYEY